MKSTVHVLSLCVLIALSSACVSAQGVPENGVTAHRGNSSEFPENSIAAFESAILMGADWVELDIFKTADGRIVICHDAKAKRLAGVDLEVGASTSAQLLELDMAHGFRAKHEIPVEECPPLRIIFLEDALRLILKHKKARASIQPKNSCVKEAIEIIRSMNALDWVGFNDGNLKFMAQVKELEPLIPVFWDRGSNWNVENDITTAKKLGFETLVVHQDGIDAAQIRRIQKAGLKAGAWDVNSPAVMKKFLRWGIDRIYTDLPRTLLSLKKEGEPVFAAPVAEPVATAKAGVYRAPAPEQLARVRHVVFDMDGTIYSGGTLFPYTKATFDQLEKLGISYTFLTNNSSTSVKDYASKIKRLGLKGGVDDVFTSSLATLAWMKSNHPDARSVYLLGTESLAREFRDAGYRVFTGDAADEPDLVVVAFDTSLDYASLCKAAWWVSVNKPYLATHPDLVCPTEQKTVLVDCGGLVECIAAVTGRRPDKIPGKPDPAMIRGILQKHDLKPEEVVMVGDRLYTDMRMAERSGVLGALVLTGEATLDDLNKSDLAPEIVVENISVLAKLLADSRKPAKN